MNRDQKTILAVTCLGAGLCLVLGVTTLTESRANLKSAQATIEKAQALADSAESGMHSDITNALALGWMAHDRGISLDNMLNCYERIYQEQRTSNR